MNTLLSDFKKKIIFQALGSILVENFDEVELTSKSFAKAVTMNENLKSLGYTLNPNDIIRISKLKQFQDGNLYIDKLIKEFEPEVRAKPMYPNFPEQVMNMDEVTFRFHQIMHYFSFALNETHPETQNIKAWLPDVEDTDKIKADNTLLKAKTIALIDEKGLIDSIIKMIEKRERWTNAEIELVTCFIDKLKNQKYKVGFKENLTHIIDKTLIQDNNTQKTRQLFDCFAQNPNDVLDCLEYSLNKKRNGGYLYE